VSLPGLREAAARRGGAWWTLSAFDAGDESALRIEADAVPSLQGNVDGATAHVGELVAAGWSVVVAASGPGLADRARDVLAERGVAARRVDDLPGAPEPGVATVVEAPLERGFEAPGAKLA